MQVQNVPKTRYIERIPEVSISQPWKGESNRDFEEQFAQYLKEKEQTISEEKEVASNQQFLVRFLIVSRP